MLICTRTSSLEVKGQKAQARSSLRILVVCMRRRSKGTLLGVLYGVCMKGGANFGMPKGPAAQTGHHVICVPKRPPTFPPCMLA